MVEASESPDVEMEVFESDYDKKVKAVYPLLRKNLLISSIDAN